MSTPTATTGAPGKYLTVVLASEAYGISVSKVREIIRLQKVTPVPQMPDFVKGVINLRGHVIPVIDLRLRFNLQAEVTDRTCIVVVRVRPPAGPVVQMGLIVDAVEEVVNLGAADLQPTPDFGLRVDTSYLLGLARVKNEVKMLLDIDRVVAPDTVHALVPVA